MITLKAEILKKDRRKDGTYNVKIRLTYKRQVRRLSTSIYVQSRDLTKSLKLKNKDLIQKTDDIIRDYRKKLLNFDFENYSYSLDDVILSLNTNPQPLAQIDFIHFSKEWIDNTSIKGKKNYQSALNSFITFLGKESLLLSSLTPTLLNDYMSYLLIQKNKRDNKLLRSNKRIPSFRALSLYMNSLRHLFKEAQIKNQDLVPKDPFLFIHIPKPEMTRKRALSPQTILDIYNLPYRKEYRFNLAKDCFILSFCLIGMNSIDLYSCNDYNGTSITYLRSKTKDRRVDNAKMVVTIPAMVKQLFQKYQDTTHQRVFNFYQHYSSPSSFNRAINIGLKQIGNLLGIEDLEYYAARHSWATIALNKCNVDKYTVHSALNHIDPSMKVTDIYIERDFMLENSANEKVLNYTFSNHNLPTSQEEEYDNKNNTTFSS